MSGEAFFVLGVLIVASILLISGRLRSDLVALLVMVVLGLSNIITRDEVFSGFSGSAVMTIVGISIISIALHQTGVTNRLGDFMYRMSVRRGGNAVLVVLFTSAALSLFMNNIAAVGVLLPAVMNLTRTGRMPASRLMMPLAYGTVLGGMATLLTTSNIIVSGALAEAGYHSFGLLDFFPIGLPVLLGGAVYMAVVGQRLLPSGSTEQADRNQQLRTQLSRMYGLYTNLSMLEILPGSPMASRTISQGAWGARTGINILGFIRNNQSYFAPTPNELLLVGDRLLVQGEPNTALMVELGVKLVSKPSSLDAVTSETAPLAEVVIGPHSSLISSTLRDSGFRERYHVNVLGLWRENEAILAGIPDLKLRSGDALLVQGPATNIHLLSDAKNLFVLQEDPDAVLRPGKQKWAIIITLLTLGFASLGVLPVSIVVFTGAILLILSGCLSMTDIYAGIEWKAIFLIAGMWTLSIAMRTTGLALVAVEGLINLLGAFPPLVMAAALIFVSFLLTQVMSGQVSALVMAPLAIAAANLTGADARSMGMAVALGCSLAFATPFGHPVNVMVMSTGGYTVKDFLRVGGPLTVLSFVLILIGLSIFWGL